MKKILWWGLLGIVLIVGLILYRAFFYYADQQYHPESRIKTVAVTKNQVAQRLSQAIQIETISSEDKSQFIAQNFIAFHQFLKDHFPHANQFAKLYVVNDYSLVYEFKGTDSSLKPMLFMGHIDVVPADEATLSEWKHPPFSGAIADGVIWGRGAVDDKAAVVALMEAMELQLAQGKRPQRSIYFSFGHDEEIGGKDGAAKVAEFFKQRNISFDMILDEGGVIVEGVLAGFSQPIALVGVAEKGYANIQMTVTGDGGHSSMPPNHTAAGVLAMAITKLESNQFSPSLKFTNLIFDAIGHYADFGLRLGMANQWLLSSLAEDTMLKSPSSAAGLRTTTAVTMLKGSNKSNVLPSHASAVVNLRLMPGETPATALSHIEQVVNDPRVELKILTANPASPVSSHQSPQFKMVEQTIREIMPDTLVAPFLVIGGTDAKHFSELSENIYRFLMIRFTPDTLSSFHGVNERIDIDDYVMSIQYFYELFNKVSFGLNQ